MNRRVIACVAAALMFSVPAMALAEAPHKHWNHEHPRRAEVNRRLNHQNQRIHNERKKGEITAAQAHQLHKEDRQIRREERAMAARHHGHITTREQHMLNQQENAVSKQIGR